MLLKVRKCQNSLYPSDIQTLLNTNPNPLTLVTHVTYVTHLKQVLTYNTTSKIHSSTSSLLSLVPNLSSTDTFGWFYNFTKVCHQALFWKSNEANDMLLLTKPQRPSRAQVTRGRKVEHHWSGCHIWQLGSENVLVRKHAFPLVLKYLLNFVHFNIPTYQHDLNISKSAVGCGGYCMSSY